MTKLTPELKKILDKATVMAKPFELFMVSYWDIFKPKKSKRLIECLQMGMHWMAAYKEAKEFKSKK